MRSSPSTTRLLNTVPSWPPCMVMVESSLDDLERPPEGADVPSAPVAVLGTVTAPDFEVAGVVTARAGAFTAPVFGFAVVAARVGAAAIIRHSAKVASLAMASLPPAGGSGR